MDFLINGDIVNDIKCCNIHLFSENVIWNWNFVREHSRIADLVSLEVQNNVLRQPACDNIRSCVTLGKYYVSTWIAEKNIVHTRSCWFFATSNQSLSQRIFGNLWPSRGTITMMMMMTMAKRADSHREYRALNNFVFTTHTQWMFTTDGCTSSDTHAARGLRDRIQLTLTSKSVNGRRPSVDSSTVLSLVLGVSRERDRRKSS